MVASDLATVSEPQLLTRVQLLNRSFRAWLQNRSCWTRCSCWTVVAQPGLLIAEKTLVAKPYLRTLVAEDCRRGQCYQPCPDEELCSLDDRPRIPGTLWDNPMYRAILFWPGTLRSGRHHQAETRPLWSRICFSAARPGSDLQNRLLLAWNISSATSDMSWWDHTPPTIKICQVKVRIEGWEIAKPPLGHVIWG